MHPKNPSARTEALYMNINKHTLDRCLYGEPKEYTSNRNKLI